MDLTEFQSKVDIAVDTVVSVTNKALEYMGVRKDLYQLAHARDRLAKKKTIFPLHNLEIPLVINSEKLIKEAIEKKWRLTETFSYHIKFLERTIDEYSQYYYFEVVFSQPTVEVPVPQATASVFFKVEDNNADPPAEKPIPLMSFTVEGHHTSHDVRYVRLIPDWILEVLIMKIKFFKRVENIRLF